jgi:integrase
MQSLLEAGHAANTINKSGISAISSLHTDIGLPTPTKSDMVKRMKQIVSNLAPPPQRTRPLLPHQILQIAQIAYTTSDRSILQTFYILLIMFLTFTRPSELVELQTIDVNIETVPSKSGPKTVLVIFIPKRKNDQERRGHTIMLGSNNTTLLCPIMWHKFYLQFFKPRPSDPYFYNIKTKSRRPYDSNYPNKAFKTLFKLAHISPDTYTATSAKSGGVTTAAMRGLATNLIKRHGGWKSDAVYIYMNHDTDSRLQVSQQLLSDTKQTYIHSSSLEWESTRPNNR